MFLTRKVIILEHESDDISARELIRFATQAQRAVKLAGEVTVRITSSRELRELNRRFRRKKQATDVLSFPSVMPEVGGDIAISQEIAARNAAQLGHSTESELKILILHGMLHLAGHDHESDNGEMRRLESDLRRQLNLPGSLLERAHAARPTPRNPAGLRRRGGSRR